MLTFHVIHVKGLCKLQRARQKKSDFILDEIKVLKRQEFRLRPVECSLWECLWLIFAVLSWLLWWLPCSLQPSVRSGGMGGRVLSVPKPDCGNYGDSPAGLLPLMLF